MASPCMLASIAWHPSPLLHGLYAIANKRGDVLLVHGRRHKIVREWPCRDLLEQAPSGGQMQLSWSADGSMLIVAAAGALPIIRFGALDNRAGAEEA